MLVQPTHFTCQAFLLYPKKSKQGLDTIFTPLLKGAFNYELPELINLAGVIKGRQFLNRGHLITFSLLTERREPSTAIFFDG